MHPCIKWIPCICVPMSMLLWNGFKTAAFEHPLGTEEFWNGKKKFVDFTTLHNIPPVLLFAGWMNFFCTEHQLHDYQDLREISKNDVRLVLVGPYTHWDIMAMQPVLFRALFDFFDTHLLLEQNDNLSSKTHASVRVFNMGHDRGWQELESWPPSNVSTRTFVLAQGYDGKNDKDGELMLVEDTDDDNKELKETIVEYSYDPADPTPQIGGGTFNPTNCGRLPPNKVQARDDVLVFTSKPFEKPTTIAGQIRASLNAISNVEGTDYVVRACHVTPDGVSENIADGIVRRFDLAPGVVTQIPIVMSPVMNCFAAGDCLRIHICSSAFPKHGRHLNTSDSFHLAVEPKISNQQIILGGNNGSRLEVPILDD